IPAETGFQRKMDGTSLTYLEQREYKYREMEGDNVLHLDGTREISEIQIEIQNWINDRAEL
ncbi:MAG: hypothetical protein OEY89_01975, partial [Gammaproteobacteria bacterium]|nr:hypothetical protein [Gammaproteobacteria bacterium]